MANGDLTWIGASMEQGLNHSAQDYARAAKLNSAPSAGVQQNPSSPTNATMLAALGNAPESLRTHPLYPHLMGAIEQAMYGKGERHGGARTPFLEQPWLHYAEMHGRGFLTGQAAKKLEEAASTKTGEAFMQEIRGAIVYLGMTLIYHEMVQKREAAQDT